MLRRFSALSFALACACGSDGTGNGPAGSGGSAGAGASPGVTVGPLDDVTLYANFGDSVGAGYNADGENGASGRGYARLVFENHPDHPAYATHSVRARFPDATFADLAKSGGESSDVVEQVALAPETTGDALATIYVGGNDFKADVTTLLDATKTQNVIDTWVANMTNSVQRLRTLYAHPEAGRDVVIVVATIHEPTDGMRMLPAQFSENFCGVIQTLLMLDEPTQQTVWNNLLHFNDSIRQFAGAQGLLVLDSQTLVVGHGLNSPDSDRWIASDCTHFTNLGHHELRREIWRLATGESH